MTQVLVVVNEVTGQIHRITTDKSDARVTATYAYEETKQRHQIYPGELTFSDTPWDDRT